MRVLAINHMFVHEAYRTCMDELGAFDDIDLTVLTPDGWRMNGQQWVCAPPRSDAPYKLVTGKASWRGKENRGFYRSGIMRAFQSARPEVILLMEEPFSLFALQILTFREIFAKDVPVVFFTWNNTSLDDFDYRPTIWYRTVTRWTLPRMQFALTANSDGITVLRQKGFRFSMKPIGYGVDTELFIRPAASKLASIKVQYEIPSDAHVIGYVGRLIHMKGVDLLMEAFARLLKERVSKSILLLIGSGNAEAELHELAKQLGIADRVRHIGSVPQSDIPTYMSLLDTLVLPSRRSGMWCEQFGRVLIEAMALRIAIIGSSSGAIPEVIGDAGYVFIENNSADLFAKLLTVCRLSEAERQELLDRGERRARNRYSWRSFASSCHDALHTAYHQYKQR